jgi:hypothetical protein
MMPNQTIHSGMIQLNDRQDFLRLFRPTEPQQPVGAPEPASGQYTMSAIHAATSLPKATKAQASEGHALKAKQANAAARLSANEHDLHDRVYRLHGLTPQENKLVEEGRGA